MPRIDYRLLREQVAIEAVLALVDYVPVRQIGDNIRGPCPIHGSKSKRSKIFSACTQRNIFQCFKCEAKGNQLDLWMAVSGLPIYESALELCDKLGIEPPLLTEKRSP